MKKWIIICISIVCVTLVGLAVAAGPNGASWHRTPEEKIAYMKSKLTDKLQLDESQKATLDSIADQLLSEHSQMKEGHAAFKGKFTELLTQESVSPEEIKALFDTKKPVMEDLMEMASVHIAEFHSVLTPEQRATLVEEIKSHQRGRCRFLR